MIFFDKQGIYLNIIKDWEFTDLLENDDMSITTSGGFISEVIYDGLRYDYDANECWCKNRDEAEIKGFTKAFEILESRLNNEK